MPRAYEVVFGAKLLDQFFLMPKADRRRLTSFFQSLETDPQCTGDFEEMDADGRQNQVKIVGKWAVTFWPDHAVCEVRIVRLELA